MTYSNEYEIDELIPVVAWLSEKYTTKENSSISVERAQQLMEAALYCINALEEEGSYLISSKDKLPAFEAYKMGYQTVLDKVQNTRKRYEELLGIFRDYGNENLRDTVQKGLLGFFKFYDERFEPQNTILTLDYPVLATIDSTGINAISQYMEAIFLEQKFLSALPYEFVCEVLTGYEPMYTKQFFNICVYVCRYIVFTTWIKQEFDESSKKNSYEKLWILMRNCSFQEMLQTVQHKLHDFLVDNYEEAELLEMYFMIDMKDCCYRLSQIENLESIKNIVYLQDNILR